MIKLPYGGPGASFDEQELIDYIKSKNRDYIIQGQQQCRLENHTKPNSLDYWLRVNHSKGRRDTKQAVNEVIQQLVATGKFVIERRLSCPDSGRRCKGLRLAKVKIVSRNGTEIKNSFVERLFYKVILSKYTDYDKAPPISGETEDFKWQLSKDQLAIEMKTHCATAGEAKKKAEEFLKDWEIWIGINQGPNNLKFRFESAEIVDLNLNNHKSILSRRASLSCISTTLDAILHISHNEFVPPPQNFKVSPEVEMMFIKYKMYHEGRASLLGMAYWCLTVMENAAGGRHKAADQYRIEPKVLSKLGELCSDRGDVKQARKMKAKAGTTPLKPSEQKWILTVVKRLILRVGEYAYDPVARPTKITMADFPALTH